MAQSIPAVFTEIYDTDTWVDGSGPGSASEGTIGYRRFLQEFLLWNRIERVVDVGCGDWQFSRFIDWRGIDYTGIDVVESVIDANTQRFGDDHVRFVLGDGGFDALPPADLLIAKDVLQHLNTRAIRSFLSAARNYRFVLVANGAEPAERTNAFIKNGGYRPVDLRDKPFHERTTVVYSFSNFAGRNDVHLLTHDV